MTIEDQIEQNLRESTEHAMHLFQRCAQISDTRSPEALAAAARFGAFINRSWRLWLILLLTHEALERSGARPRATRERVREWQTETFGRAVGRSQLHQFAQCGPGARGAPLEIAHELAAWAAATYERHAPRLAAACAAKTGKTKA